MKIGIVRRQFGAGGAESALIRFGDALMAAGHACLLYSSNTPSEGSWKHGYPAIRPLPGRTPLQFANALRKLSPKRECDVLFSFERVWSCDCYRAGDGVHAAWLERRSKYEALWKSGFRRVQGKHREILRLEAALFQPEAVKAVIANSEMVKREIIAHFSYPAERIRVIYNGAPPPAQSSERANARRSLGIEPNRLVALFAGGGWDRKGLGYAIEAIDRVNASAPLLVVAGRGNPAGYRRSERVRYLGAVPDLTNCFAAADLFVLPTLYDPFSNACLEAAAAGLPVVTTAANGFSEIMTPGAEGEVIPEPDDIETLVAAIESWAAPEKRREAVPRIRAMAARFSVEANLDQTLSVLRSLLD